eukprot:3259761-Rhodomonas_salina.1
MITYFENSITVVPMFDDVGVQLDTYWRADYNSVPFNSSVVALASLCGKNFQLLDYMNVDADLWKVVASLHLDLSSFCLQIKNTCKTHHSDVYLANDSTITAHLLREVIKWKLLKLLFNPFKALSTGNDWVELQEAIMVDLSLNFDSLSSHMVCIALLLNKAVSSSSEQDINSKILRTLIKKLQETDRDEFLLPVCIWRAASTKWYTNYQKDQSLVPWSKLRLAVSKELLQPKSPDSSSSSKRPKLHPSVPPCVAFQPFLLAPSPTYDPQHSQVQSVGIVVSKVTRTAFVHTLSSNSNKVVLVKGKGSEGSEGLEGLEGEEIQGLWAEEGECQAEFTPGAEGARWAEFTPQECLKEFTPGSEGARNCRAEVTPGAEGARDCRAELTPGAEGVRDCRAEFTPDTEGVRDCRAEFTPGEEGTG